MHRFLLFVTLGFAVTVAPALAFAQGVQQGPAGRLSGLPGDDFQPGTAGARLLAPESLTRTDQGLLMGQGKFGPRVEVPGWDGRAGSVAMWVQPVDWGLASPDQVTLLRSDDAPDGLFLLMKKADQIQLVGRQSDGGQRRQLVLVRHRGLDWPNGQWRHVAISWGPGGAQIYIDGQLIGERTMLEPWPGSFSTLSFGPGNHERGTGVKSQTLMRDIRVYTRPLTPGEAGQLASQQPKDAGAGSAPGVKPAAASDATHVSIARIATAPRLDAVIEDDEYPTSLSGLVDVGTHTLYPEPASLHFGADDTKLYIAAELALPPNAAAPKVVATTRDHRVLQESADSFVMLVRADDDVESQRFEADLFIVAPDGQIWDGKERIDWSGGAVSRDAERNYDLNVRSSVEGKRWVIEMSIPLEQLGLTDAPAFSLSAGFTLQGQRLVLQDHPAWFDHPQAFATADFTPLAIRSHLGRLNQGRVSPRVMMANPGDEAQQVDVGYVVATPQIEETAEDFVFDQQIGQKLNVEMRQLLHRHSETVDAPARGQAAFEDSHDMVEPGVYLLRLEAKSGDRTLLRRRLPFVYFSPITAKLTPIPSREQLEVDLSLYGLELEANQRLEVAFIDEGGDAVTRESFDLGGSHQAVVASMSSVPPGQYEVRLSLLDTQGQTVASRSYPFKKWPEEEWLKHRVGLEALQPDWAPAPWTPIEVEGQTVRVWGRQYTFERGSLLPRTLSQGRALIDRPVAIRYQLSSDATTHDLAPAEASIHRDGDGWATIQQQGESAHFKLEARQQIEFDGFQKIKLTLTPRKPLSMNAMFIDIPVEEAEWYTAAPRWNQGMIERKLEFDKVTRLLWLGDAEGGVLWAADSFKGWKVDSQRPRSQLLPAEGDQPARLRLLLTNRPVTIDEPMQIEFALHTTPVKPMPPGFEEWRPNGMAWSGPPSNQWIAKSTRWSVAESTLRPRSPQVLQDMVETTHRAGLKVYPYTNPFYVSSYSSIHPDAPFSRDFPTEYHITTTTPESEVPEAFYYKRDWAGVPGFETGNGTGARYYCSPSTTWADFFTYQLDHMLATSDLDGIYMDLTQPYPFQDNLDARFDFAYETLDGVVEGSQEVVASRDFFKRLYWVFEDRRGQERLPYFLGHGQPYVMPWASFWSLLFHGEGYKPPRPYAYTDWYLQTEQTARGRVTSVDAAAARNYDAVGFRLAFPQQAMGLPMMVLPQYAKGNADAATRRQMRTDPAMVREILSFTELHNVLFWPLYTHSPTFYEYWDEVETPFGMADTEFHGWWKNGLRCSPDSVRVSYHRKPDRDDYLFYVANWSGKEVTARVELPSPIAALPLVVDMQTDERFKSGPTLVVTIPPHDFRAIRISGDSTARLRP